MNFTLKQKALAITVGAFALAALAAFVVAFIVVNVPTDTILEGLGVAAFVYFAYIFYSITLGQLEYKAKLKEMVDSKSKK